MDELVKNLARARAERREAEDVLAGLRAEFDGRPDVVAARKQLSAAEAYLEHCDAVLRLEALGCFRHGLELHPAVKVRKIQKIIYEPTRAIAWCIANLSAALKLDTRLFEKHARAVVETAPLDFVEFTVEPQVMIDADITPWLDA